MREWATVVSWQQGVALLHCQPRKACNNCHSSRGCGGAFSNNANSNKVHQLQIPISQALVPGQQVELGFSESGLLSCALLVYFLPLLGLISSSFFCHMLFAKEAITVIGGLMGGIYGFIIARMAAAKIATKDTYQPVVLKINLPIHHVSEKIWSDPFIPTVLQVAARRPGRPTDERQP